MKIVIVGAGLGGLTFGALAAKDGHEVTIYDKNAEVGGVLTLAKQNGFCWEQGPLILGDLLPGEPVYELLDSLGVRLETVRAERGIVMPDYEMWRPQDYEGPYWRREKLKRLFPENAAGIDRYYRFYEDMLYLRSLGMRPQTILTKLRTLLAYGKVRRYAKMTADELTRHFFQDNERIRALFTGILADFCADPSEVQGLGIPFCNIENAFDLRIPTKKGGKPYYPGYCSIVGGCQKLPEALMDAIARKGGRFVPNAVVEKVLVEDGRAIGVRLADGAVETADVVVGSGGGRDFFERTLGREHLDDAYRGILDTYRPMEAVFMLHLGVDYDPMRYMQAPLCYYYKTYDIHAATERLRAGIYHEGEDGFLIYVPSAHAKEFAPAGKHAVTIYTIAPDTLAAGTWSENKEAYARRLIELASDILPELSAHIVEQKIMTAEDYRTLTHMEKCSFGGVVPIWKQKNPPHVTPVKGLFFVGQQSENAGGVSVVMLGAKSAYADMKRQSRI